MESLRTQLQAPQNDHTTAIVPLQCWAYESPLRAHDRHRIDVGLLAEALIYYDRVLIIPATHVPVAKVLSEPGPPRALGGPFDAESRLSFVELIEWFSHQRAYADLVALFKDGTLNVLHYAFYTVPTLREGVYSCWNMQDTEQERGPTFGRRFLGNRQFDRVVPRARHREKLLKALEGHVTELPASEFGPAVENARLDFVDARAATQALQAFLDEMRDALPAHLRRQVHATGATDAAGNMRLTFDIDFQEVTAALSPLEFGVPTPLCGLAHSNRLIWSGARMSCDLYLPTPVSRLVNAKLVESSERRMKSQEVMETLELKVAFPDVRTLVNTGQLSIRDVLKIRSKAQRFRQWLQTQAERDRDALLAYHYEVAHASALSQRFVK